MPLPKDVDAMVRAALQSAIEECQRFEQEERRLEDASMAEQLAPQADPLDPYAMWGPSKQGLAPHHPSFVPAPAFDRGRFAKVQHDALAICELLGAGRPPVSAAVERIKPLRPSTSSIETIRGILQSLESSYRQGVLEPLFAHLDAALAGDYLAQAQELLEERHRDKSDHVPAAVLIGAVFERKIRALCAAQTPPIEVVVNGKPKKVSALLDDLRKANVYNETKTQELRWIARIRNHAAHGEFEEFTRSDVERMNDLVRRFLEEY